MSTNLYWRLPPKQTKDRTDLDSTALKHIICERYCDNDGSLRNDWFNVGEEAISFLDGVIFASDEKSELSTCARKLIEYIQAYGSVQMSTR